MGYVESNLMSQEEILYEGDIHWFIFVPGAALLLISIVFMAKEAMAAIGTILFLVAVVLLVKAFLFKISTEVAVTSKRVIAKMGFIRRKTVELNHQKVESLNVNQGIIGRIFNFGTVIVNGTGGSRTPIPNICNPLDFRRESMEIIDDTQNHA